MSGKEPSSYPVQDYFPAQCRECPTLVGMIEDGEFGEFPRRQVAQDFAQYCIREAIGDAYLEGCETGPFTYSEDDIETIACGMPKRVLNQN
jgi:hypothetical protein